MFIVTEYKSIHKQCMYDINPMNICNKLCKTDERHHTPSKSHLFMRRLLAVFCLVSLPFNGSEAGGDLS